MQSLSTHPHADGESGEVLQFTKLFCQVMSDLSFMGELTL